MILGSLAGFRSSFSREVKPERLLAPAVRSANLGL